MPTFPIASIKRNDLDTKTNLDNRTPQGFYIPLFRELCVSNPTGLAIANGGGIIATTQGTLGTGFINFPEVVRPPRIWRMAVLLEYNGDTAANTQIMVEAMPLIPNNNLYGIDFGFSAGKFAGASLFSGGFTPVVGAKYWAYLVSDGFNVTFGFIPEAAHKGLHSGAGGALAGEWDLYFTHSVNLIRHQGQPFQVSPWQILGRLRISQGSTTNKILGIFLNIGGYGGCPDPQFRPPGIINFADVNGDNTAIIRIPENYQKNNSAQDAVIIFHPNGSDERTLSASNGTDQGTAFAKLQDAGYINAFMRGTNDFGPNTYTGPLASNWGAPAGLRYWKALIDRINLQFGPIRNFYAIGSSMGCLNALAFHMNYPGILKAIVGISGVCNMTYSYTTELFSNTINLAYGTSTVNDVRDKDPINNPAAFKNIPIKLWHGDADNLISKTQHADLFKTRVEAAGGIVEVVNVPGAGHLNPASLYDGNAIVSFFQANV